MTPVLELRNVSKSFLDNRTGRSTSVIEDISLTINRGDALALIGPNGSGKSTLLRLIVGLDQPSSGTIVRPSGADPLSAELMFQDFRSTFLPWFSLSRNVTFPFRNSPTDRAIALDTLRTLAPDLSLDAFPRTLSGGELQAAALARSASRRVDLLLLDEPFGSLDLAVRSRALTVCREAVESRRTDALVLVTQNLEDVAALAERVVVIQSHPGRIASEFVINASSHHSRSESRSASMELLLSKVREVLK